MHDRLHIEACLATARHERARAFAVGIRWATRWLWTCPECNDTRTMFRQQFENGEPVGPEEEIPCNYPGCNRPSISLQLRYTTTRN